VGLSAGVAPPDAPAVVEALDFSGTAAVSVAGASDFGLAETVASGVGVDSGVEAGLVSGGVVVRTTESTEGSGVLSAIAEGRTVISGDGAGVGLSLAEGLTVCSVAGVVVESTAVEAAPFKVATGAVPAAPIRSSRP